MLKQTLTYYSEEVHFPSQTIPEWANSVSRWHQLDAASFVLVEACQRWKDFLKKPSFIILASASACHEADLDFVKSGARSPSKMIHTLASTRASPLCQSLNWSGPMLCLQKGVDTQKVAISEAATLISEEYPQLWILGVENICQGKYRANLCELKVSEEELFQNIPVDLLLDVLPHRPPLLWIDKVDWSNINEGVCSLLLNKEAHYFDFEKIRNSSFLEWMAQAYGFIRACSTLTKTKNTESKNLQKTFLAAVNHFEIEAHQWGASKLHAKDLLQNKKIFIHMKTVKELAPLFSISGEIKNEDGCLLAKGNLKVYAE